MNKFLWLLLLPSIAMADLNVCPRMPTAAAVSHNFLTSILASGATTLAQPACGDLSNAANSCSVDATNASNIGTGTLGAARLPNFTGPITSVAGVNSIAAQTGTGSTFVVQNSPNLTGQVGIGGTNPGTSQVQITSPTTVTGTLTNSAAGTAITGTSTLFLTEFHIGDTITMNAETQTITGITSDTAMTTTAWTGANSGATATRSASADFFQYPNGNFQSGGSRTTITGLGISNASSVIVSTAASGAAATSPLTQSYLFTYSGATANSPSLNFVHARGTEASPSALNSADILGGINFRGFGSALTNIGAVIQGLTTEIWSGSARGSKLIFQTTPNTTTSTATVLTLDQDASALLSGVLGVNVATTSTTSLLRIGGGTNPLSGTAQVGLNSTFTGTSAATSSMRGVQTALTQAGSTTTTNIYDFYSNIPTAGSGSTITNFADYTALGSAAHVGTNNAALTDTSTLSGNKFIYQTGTDFSLLTGSLEVGGTNTSSSTPFYTKSTGGTNAVGAAFNATATNGVVIQMRQNDVTHTYLGSAANAIGVGAATDSAVSSVGTLYLGSNSIKAVTIDTAQAMTLVGAFKAPNLATSSAATTGTLCWTTGTGNVNVDTTTTCLISAREYKEKIEDLEEQEGLASVMKFRPVSYQLKEKYNPTHLGRQVGFIADEVEKVDDRLVSLDEKGKPHAVRYQQMIAVLVKAIQEQQGQIDDLKKELSKK